MPNPYELLNYVLKNKVTEVVTSAETSTKAEVIDVKRGSNCELDRCPAPTWSNYLTQFAAKFFSVQPDIKKGQSIKELCNNNLDSINPNHDSFDGKILAEAFSLEMEIMEHPLEVFVLFDTLIENFRPRLKECSHNQLMSLLEKLIKNTVSYLSDREREKLTTFLDMETLLDIQAKTLFIQDKLCGKQKSSTMGIIMMIFYLVNYLHNAHDGNNEIFNMMPKSPAPRDQIIFNKIINKKEKSINELCEDDLDIINPNHIAFDGEVLGKAFSLEIDKIKHPLELVAVFDKLKKMLVPTFEKPPTQDELMALKESLINSTLEHLSDKELQKLTRLLGKGKLKEIAEKISFLYDDNPNNQTIVEFMSIICLIAKCLYNDKELDKDINFIGAGYRDGEKLKLKEPEPMEYECFNKLILSQ